MTKTVVRAISSLIIASLLFSSLALRSEPVRAQDESIELGFLPCPGDPEDPELPNFDETKVTVSVEDLGDNTVGFDFANNYDEEETAIDKILFHDPLGLIVDDEGIVIEGSEGIEFADNDEIQLDDIACPGVSLDEQGTLAFSEVSEVQAAQTTTGGSFGFGKHLRFRFPLKVDKKVISFADILTGLKVGQLVIGIFFGKRLVLFFLYLKCEKPEGGTYIQLASFQAEKAGAVMAVRWETAAEIDNAGFNIFRASSLGGPYEKINDRLIGAKGNGAGASYEFVDSGGQIGDFYRLEDVDYNGKRTRHLPESAVSGSGVMTGHSVFLPLLTVN